MHWSLMTLAFEPQGLIFHINPYSKAIKDALFSLEVGWKEAFLYIGWIDRNQLNWNMKLLICISFPLLLK